MRRPKQDALPVPIEPQLFAELRAGVVVPLDNDEFKHRLRQAYHEGLRIDNGSDAAGEAFLALSWYNRRKPVAAIACATCACRMNRRAWEPLLEVFLGATPLDVR